MPGEPEPLSNTPEESSEGESSTSDHVEFSVETAPASTTTYSTTLTEAKLSLNLDALSPRSQAIKVLLADEMSDGFNLTTLAKELGLSESSASALLNELKTELELQTGSVPPLSKEEYEQLKDSISDGGINVPVMIGEHSLVDGRHRWRAARELGLKEIPAIFIRGLTVEQERELGVRVNAVRRQLTREQKRAMVRAELRRDPSRSSRYIASLCGVYHQMVETVRQDLRKEAETVPSHEDVETQRVFIQEAVETEKAPEVEKRLGADGRLRAVPPRPAQVEQERHLGFVNCARCGQRHALFREGSGFRLETV